eukprot:TRINITY_DN11560_c0_g1_i3.p1 TRINITY_DN11560_c0_g1~~TRINITY_DN11560_c0_g1_i3.p1  ORF type:complete len:184 (-),score=17.07 TRINITY_DN11560_c0_g1_i3:124-675(-)
MKAQALVLLATLIVASYQVENMCNKRWAYNQIANTNTTICENYLLGSLLALVGNKVAKSDIVCPPGTRNCNLITANEWLIKNNGWDGTSGLNWKVLERFGIYLGECTTDQRKMYKWHQQNSLEFEIIINTYDGNMWGEIVKMVPEDFVGIYHGRSHDTMVKIDWSQIVKGCKLENERSRAKKL